MNVPCRPLLLRLRASALHALLCGTILLGPLCCLPSSAWAQADSTSPGAREAPTTRAAPSALGPTGPDQIRWHEVIFLDFDAEAVNRAKALTQLCLSTSAATTSSRAPLVVETPGGPWDLMLIYSLEGSAREAPALEKKWKSPADLSRLRAACRNAAGQETGRTWDEYRGLLAGSTSLVGFSGRIGGALEGAPLDGGYRRSVCGQR